MQKIDRRLIFKNIYDSGIVDVWFSAIAYSLIVTAFVYLSFNGHSEAAPLAIISYMFMSMKIIHGSRAPYEYLKKIYVYSQNNKLISGLFHVSFLYIRIQIIIAPFQVIYWSYSTGKLPL